MSDEVINFEEILSDETFSGLKNVVFKFLDTVGGLNNATLKLNENVIFMHRHGNNLELHINGYSADDADEPEYDEDV